MGWKNYKNGMYLKDFIRYLKPHLKRLKQSLTNPKDFPHAFTNVFVEACKLHYYHAGHIWMLQTVLTLVIIIFLLVKIF